MLGWSGVEIIHEDQVEEEEEPCYWELFGFLWEKNCGEPFLQVNISNM